MNTPLILTSVALLAGVAARPIENTRHDLHELVRNPDSDDKQAFLERIPAGIDSLSLLQLHDVHDKERVHGKDDEGKSTSPKLMGSDKPSDPDPGMQSPYMSPERYLAAIEQEPEASSSLSDAPPAQSSPTSHKADYSPVVVPLVLASLAALVLLGLTVVVVYVTQLLRQSVLRHEVWQSITEEAVRSEKGNVVTVGRTLEGSRKQEAMAQEASASIESTMPYDASDDLELAPLSEHPPGFSTSTLPAVRHQVNDHTLGPYLVAWTYDNWITHFIIAVFGFFGIFLGGTRTNDLQ